MDTDALIGRLAADAPPVRRLPPPWLRTALWLALGLPPLIAVIAVHGVDTDPAALLGDGRFLVEQAAALATALSAATLAFAATVPGASRRWLWLPLVPLAVWLAALGKGCLDDWIAYGPEGLAIRLDTDCLVPMILIGVVPLAAMIVMLKRGAPLAPRLTLALGTLAAAAIVNFALRLFHVGDVTIMVLVWHFGLLAVATLAAAVLGPRVLFWRTWRRPAGRA